MGCRSAVLALCNRARRKARLSPGSRSTARGRWS